MPDFGERLGANNLDNVQAWVALATNPEAFNEKLERFKAAQNQALQAQREADERIALIGTAQQIPELHAQAKAAQEQADAALAAAQEQARDIMARAQDAADAIMAQANKNVEIAQDTLLEAAKKADARASSLDEREAQLSKRENVAATKAGDADAAKAQYEQLAEIARERTSIVEARLVLINTEFDKFLRSVNA